MNDADKQIIRITLKYVLQYVLFKGPWGKEGTVTRFEQDGLDVFKKELTRFEQDGMDVFKKELIFEIEKVLQKKRVQKTMNSEAGRLLLGPYP